MNFISNIANTKFGLGCGIFAFIFGTYFLIINERNYKRTLDTILEAESVVEKVNDVNIIDSESDNKLIYGVSKTRTDEIISDGLFEVSVNAIKIIRSVEYYQWVQDSHLEEYEDYSGKTHSKKVYTYEKQWTDKLIDSEKFEEPKYRNRAIFRIAKKDIYADQVYWGAYELPPFLKSKIDGVTPIAINLSKGGKAAWEEALKKEVRKYYQDSVEVTGEYLHLIRANTVHLGANPASPKIGDIRVTMTYIPPGRDLSVIAQVQGNTFTKYTSKNGKSFFSVQNGTVGIEAMFKAERETNTSLTWFFRIFGLFCVIFGIRFTLRLVTNLFAKIPIIGDIVNAGVKTITFIVGFVWSFIIIGIAYLFYRPLIGIAVLLIAVGLIWILKKKGEVNLDT